MDLVSKTVHCGNVVAPFEIDDYTRWRLLEGLDDIGLTLQHEEDITAYEATRPAFKPTTLPARTSCTGALQQRRHTGPSVHEPRRGLVPLPPVRPLTGRTQLGASVFQIGNASSYA